MLNSFTLIGSSSGRNAGDAAILSGMMDAIDQACGTRKLYEIPTYRPQYVKEIYKNNVRSISMLPWHGTAGMLGVPTYRSMMRTDATLIFDNMLFDKKLYNPLFNFMSTMSLFLPRAKRAGKMLGCYNIGVGPVHTPRGRSMLCDILDLMDFIAVRDEESLSLLRDVGCTNQNVVITADAALSVQPAPPERVDAIMRALDFDQEKEILAINVNKYLNTWVEGKAKPLTPEQFVTTYARALDTVASRIGAPLLFVCTQHHDVALTKAIMQKMTSSIKKTLFTNESYDHYEVKGVLSRVSLLFAMRLHANILASSALAPIIGLAFQKKVTSYYRLLGLSESALAFQDFSEDALVAHIEKGWATKAETRRVLEKRIPELQAKAYTGAELLARIAGGANAHQTIGALAA